VSLPALLLWVAGCASGEFAPRPGPGQEGVWAIRCTALRGPERQRQAEDCAKSLGGVAGLRADGVLVVDNGRESIVYYGRYRRDYDARSGEHRYRPDHLRDIELIRSLSFNTDGRVTFPFLYATMEELPTERSAPAAWDLNNADGYWSLQVAVFFNDEDITNRRQLAEEYCRVLREQGEEAYYHHGAVNSITTVGLFPKAAVQTITQKDPWTGYLTAVNRVVDERAVALQKRFPDNLHNGRRLLDIVRDPKTGEIRERVPRESFLVKVPGAAAAGDNGG
jgi:hypothetical protein